MSVQGVGDLYTDPQFHTLSGIEYGEGNLGARGMALFFRAHECDSLCEAMRLCPFPKSAVDEERLKNGLFKKQEEGGGEAGAAGEAGGKQGGDSAVRGLRPLHRRRPRRAPPGRRPAD